MVTTKELVIDKPGTYLGVRKGLFVVRGADGSRAEFSPGELSHEPVNVRLVLVQQSMLFAIFLSSDRSSRPLNRQNVNTYQSFLLNRTLLGPVGFEPTTSRAQAGRPLHAGLRPPPTTQDPPGNNANSGLGQGRRQGDARELSLHLDAFSRTTRIALP